MTPLPPPSTTLDLFYSDKNPDDRIHMDFISTSTSNNPSFQLTAKLLLNECKQKRQRQRQRNIKKKKNGRYLIVT